jgi:hypothetical protein
VIIDVVFDREDHNSIPVIMIEKELKLFDVKTDSKLN